MKQPANLVVGKPPFKPERGYFMPSHSEKEIRLTACEIAEANPDSTWYLDGAALYSDADVKEPLADVLERELKELPSHLRPSREAIEILRTALGLPDEFYDKIIDTIDRLRGEERTDAP